jgi:hypothetical protein
VVTNTRTAVAALVCTATLLLQACGGGSAGLLGQISAIPSLGCIMFPASCAAATVSGTAASGSALANVTITLKDSANNTATATTDSSGRFSIDATGLAAPFVLRATTGTGTTLYGMSSTAGGGGTSNVTPLSDVVVRSWYLAQGIDADQAFISLVASPAPTPDQAAATAQAVLPLVRLGAAASNAPIASGVDLLSMAFAADHTGVDQLLDNLHVQLSSGRILLTVVAGTGITQSSTITFDATTSSLTADSTTTGSSGSTTSASYTASLPTTTAASTALAEINAALAAFASVVNTKKQALTSSDIQWFFADDYLNDGLDKAHDLAEFVAGFSQGPTVEIAIDSVKSLDAAAGRATVTVTATQTLGTQSETESLDFYFRKTASGWQDEGNGRIASISLYAEARVNQGILAGGDGPQISLDLRPVQGTVSGVAVSGAAPWSAVTVIPGTAVSGNTLLDVFYGSTGVLQPPLPQAGTPVQIVVTRTSGAPVTYTLPLNAFTTDPVKFLNVSGNPAPGGTLTMTWSLPTTYAVQRLHLGVLTFTGSGNSGFECSDDDAILSPGATSAQITLRATCNGLPVVETNLNLSTTGYSGERSLAIYSLKNQ